MKRYDERMLRLLLDRYERSLLSEGKNSRTIHIAQKITKGDFPEYYDAASIEYEEIHRQLFELERKGIVALAWKGKKEGHILERCVLREERIADAYQMLHRTPKDEKRRRVLEILRQYEDKLPTFTASVTERLEEGRSVRQYLDEENPDALERVLRLAAAILANREEQYLRSFSIRVFHDSKAAEKELNLACSILTRFERRDLPANLETDEILEEFNIYRNPTFVFLKGDFGDRNCSNRISDAGEAVGRQGKTGREKGFPWGLREGIGIFQGDLPAVLEELEMGTANPDVILTIENLTSYHQWDVSKRILGNQELVIYLAGYANHIKREFLMALQEQFPRAEFYHFGDIDCGGFRIWKNLCVSTGIPIQPFAMNLETWQEYKGSGRALTEGDRNTLIRMMEDPFYAEQGPLFGEMLKEGIKIEQECVHVRENKEREK